MVPPSRAVEGESGAAVVVRGTARRNGDVLHVASFVGGATYRRACGAVQGVIFASYFGGVYIVRFRALALVFAPSNHHAELASVAFRSFSGGDENAGFTRRQTVFDGFFPCGHIE